VANAGYVAGPSSQEDTYVYRASQVRLSRPESAASCATRRTAAKRRLIAGGAYCLFEKDSVSWDDGSIECEARLGTVQVDEIAYGMVISSLAALGCKAV